MKREVVEDFLNLPGIVGVALMDRRSRPYFCGVDHNLNFQQKEALAQGIRQVVETTPEGFESFEFQFTGHQVYIYKLEQGMILLVLADRDLVFGDYLPALEQLKAALQADVTTAIATFRLLAGNITLTGQSYWKPPTVASAPSLSLSDATETVSPDFLASGTSTASPGSANGSSAAAIPPPPRASSTPYVTLKEVLEALNQLSEFTTQYLGTAVINNYWKSSRPDLEWLQHFQVSRNAEITFAGTLPLESGSTVPSVNAEQLQWIRSWVSAFIQRCTRVIRDFPVLVEQKGLTPSQKELLLS